MIATSNWKLTRSSSAAQGEDKAGKVACHRSKLLVLTAKLSEEKYSCHDINRSLFVSRMRSYQDVVV